MPNRSQLQSGALLALLLAACHSPGPEAIREERRSFNEAVQRTNDEQLLLNIVRLQYRDTPYFLELTSISSSLSYELEGGLSPTLIEGGRNTLGLEGVVTISNSPTVTYTPLQGNDFVHQLLTPLELRTLALLYNSGWSVERVLRLCVQSLQGIPNARSASGPTPEQAPVYERFREVAALLRRLQLRGALELGEIAPGPGDESAGLRLRIAPEAHGSPEDRRLRELLGLGPDGSDFEIRRRILSGGGDALSILPRSCLLYTSPSPRD